MIDVAADLMASLTAAYSPYVRERLRELDLECPDTLSEALEEGEVWLRMALSELLARSFSEQRRGPLEVFQEAMRFPTEALAATGVEPIARDPGAAAALPGDLYNLAPASSRLVGDEAWMAHLVWGAAKARSLRRSRLVGLLSGNFMDRTRIESLVARTGSQLVVWDGRRKEVGEGRLPDLVLVDLAAPDAIAAIERLARAGARVIAFGPHADRGALRRARQAGAEEVLARSAFFAKLGDLLA